MKPIAWLMETATILRLCCLWLTVVVGRESHNTDNSWEKSSNWIIQSVKELTGYLRESWAEDFQRRHDQGLSWRELLGTENYEETAQSIFAQWYFKLLQQGITMSARLGRLSRADAKLLIQQGFSDILADAVYCNYNLSDTIPPLTDLVVEAALLGEEAFINHLYLNCAEAPAVKPLIVSVGFWYAACRAGSTVFSSFSEHLRGRQLEELSRSLVELHKRHPELEGTVKSCLGYIYPVVTRSPYF